MKAGELRTALRRFADEDEVRLGDFLALWPDVDLSYLEDVLNQWEEIAELFGRDFPPEVVGFVESVRENV